MGEKQSCDDATVRISALAKFAPIHAEEAAMATPAARGSSAHSFTRAARTPLVGALATPDLAASIACAADASAICALATPAICPAGQSLASPTRALPTPDLIAQRSPAPAAGTVMTPREEAIE